MLCLDEGKEDSEEEIAEETEEERTEELREELDEEMDNGSTLRAAEVDRLVLFVFTAVLVRRDDEGVEAVADKELAKGEKSEEAEEETLERRTEELEIIDADEAADNDLGDIDGKGRLAEPRGACERRNEDGKGEQEDVEEERPD